MSDYVEGVRIDWETADRIAVASLKAYKESLEEQVHSHLNEGTWMHAEDLAHNVKMITALNFVMRDFGEE